MPSCVVKGCSNYDKKVNKQKDDISYHRFPSDPVRQAAWNLFIRQQREDPGFRSNEYLRVCSVHFKPNDFYWTKSGLRKLKKTAIPSAENNAFVVEDGYPLETNVEANADTYAETIAKSNIETNAERNAETKAGSNAETNTQTIAESNAETSETQSNAETNAKAIAVSNAETSAQSNAETNALSNAETNALSSAETNVECNAATINHLIMTQSNAEIHVIGSKKKKLLRVKKDKSNLQAKSHEPPIDALKQKLKKCGLLSIAKSKKIKSLQKQNGKLKEKNKSLTNVVKELKKNLNDIYSLKYTTLFENSLWECPELGLIQ